MNVTSTAQTQYTQNIYHSITKTEDKSSYEEVAKKKQPSRYEQLLDMKWENMTEAERAEKQYYNAMRPVSYLDEEGNKALNKALEGRTDSEKFSIKSALELQFMTSIKVNHDTGTIDRQKFDSIDTSRLATEDRFEKLFSTFDEQNPLDTLGIKEVVGKFLQIYTANEQSMDITNQEDSVVDDFLNDLYSKESISFNSSVLRDDINDKVNEKAKELFSTQGDSPESILNINQELNKYRQTLLDEYRQSLKDKDSLDSKKEAVIKVLLDETKKDVSALERFLTKNIDSKKEIDKSQNIDEHKLKTLDEAGNEALNKLLVGKTDEEKVAVKLVLDFRLSIKEVKIENGKLHLTYEENINPEAIKEKLDRLIYEKEISPESSSGLIDKKEWLRILNGLRDSYLGS